MGSWYNKIQARKSTTVTVWTWQFIDKRHCSRVSITKNKLGFHCFVLNIWLAGNKKGWNLLFQFCHLTGFHCLGGPGFSKRLVGNPLEIVGPVLRSPSVIFVSRWEIFGTLWKASKVFGDLWKSSRNFCNLRKPLRNSGSAKTKHLTHFTEKKFAGIRQWGQYSKT